MIRSRITGKPDDGSASPARGKTLNPEIARRSFRKLSAATAALSGAAMTGKMTVKASAVPNGQPEAHQGSRMIRSVCTHCAVACGINAEVLNGVWLRQEIARDHPVSKGGYCCRGASALAMVTSEKRLKHPLKKVNGRWRKISWDLAFDEIGAKLSDIRKNDGPDALHFNGSAKVSTEMAYLQRKFAAFWGSNNIDHQTSIRHSTTESGVANPWGYGAMTNSLNDTRHAGSMLFFGSNVAEASPVSMQHILHAKEVNKAPLIVVDPRFSKLAAKATDHVRIRPGTDRAFILGLVNVIIKNNWHDKEFIRTRVDGFPEIAEAAAHYTPEEVEVITSIPAAEVVRIARILADNRPTSLIWCMGKSRQHIGRSISRLFGMLQLVLGNMGKSGGGASILDSHDNSQGATDMGILPHSLPAYYGLADGSWQHWCRIWEVEYDWIVSRFKRKDRMNNNGFTLARWHADVPQGKKMAPETPIKALILWGSGSKSLSRSPEAKKALNMLDLLVVVDPFPTMTAAACASNNIYLLPASSQYETSGSVTSTSRQIQWRCKIVDPVHDCRDDYAIMAGLVKRLGFADKFYKNIKQVPEDITRELGRGSLAIGYNGQTPERIKKHMENWHTFAIDTLQAEGGPCDGEYYGLPWPCWTDEHPGTPILHALSKTLIAGGLPCGNRFSNAAAIGIRETSESAGGSKSNGQAKVVSQLAGGQTIFPPCHLGGRFMGRSLAENYPAGALPCGADDSPNSVTNYGYDITTQTQRTEDGL